MGVSVSYPPKSCIHNYYHGVSVLWGNLNIKVVMCQTEGLAKCPIVYYIHKNSGMLNSKHTFKKAYEMATETMCAYP